MKARVKIIAHRDDGFFAHLLSCGHSRCSKQRYRLNQVVNCPCCWRRVGLNFHSYAAAGPCFTPEERRRFDLQLAALDQVIREDPWTPFEGRLADGR